MEHSAICTVAEPVIAMSNLRLFYGPAEALHGISMGIPRQQVTALIGPWLRQVHLLRCVNQVLN